MVGRSLIEIFVALHHMMLSAEPSIEALLASVALPHSQEGGKLVNGGLMPNDIQHLIVRLT